MPAATPRDTTEIPTLGLLLGMADLVLCSGTITLIWGGSDDMKSDVVMVEIVLIVDFIFMFLCLDLVLYIEGYFSLYISH